MGLQPSQPWLANPVLLVASKLRCFAGCARSLSPLSVGLALFADVSVVELQAFLSVSQCFSVSRTASSSSHATHKVGVEFAIQFAVVSQSLRREVKSLPCLSHFVCGGFFWISRILPRVVYAEATFRSVCEKDVHTRVCLPILVGRMRSNIN